MPQVMGVAPIRNEEIEIGDPDFFSAGDASQRYLPLGIDLSFDTYDLSRGYLDNSFIAYGFTMQYQQTFRI